MYRGVSGLMEKEKKEDIAFPGLLERSSKTPEQPVADGEPKQRKKTSKKSTAPEQDVYASNSNDKPNGRENKPKEKDSSKKAKAKIIY
jgi:hypothetical protein